MAELLTVKAAEMVEAKATGSCERLGSLCLVARDRRGATFDAVLPQDDSASIEAALAGVVTGENHLIGDGGKAIAAFARKAQIPFHAVPAPGKPTAEAPHLHINNVNAYHGRLKQWLNRSTASPPRTCPTISAGGAPSKPGAIKPRRKAGSRAQSETAHINSYRYKRQKCAREIDAANLRAWSVYSVRVASVARSPGDGIRAQAAAAQDGGRGQFRGLDHPGRDTKWPQSSCERSCAMCVSLNTTELIAFRCSNPLCKSSFCDENHIAARKSHN